MKIVVKTKNGDGLDLVNQLMKNDKVTSVRFRYNSKPVFS